jgi:cell division protein FtsI/penicillin-binding protein 2
MKMLTQCAIGLALVMAALRANADGTPPGSTFKIFTLSVAQDPDESDEDPQWYDCSGLCQGA